MGPRPSLKEASELAGRERQAPVLDVVFVTVAILFFAASVGYVALCERLAS